MERVPESILQYWTQGAFYKGLAIVKFRKDTKPQLHVHQTLTGQHELDY